MSATRCRGRVATATTIALVALLVLTVGAVASARADTGYQDYGFGSSGALTGNKESKLWYTAGGQWWGVLTPAGGGGLNIHRLDRTTHTWVNTGIQVDASSSKRPDVLFDGNRLYVAVHGYSSTNKAGAGATLTRYDFVNGSWSRVGPAVTFNGYLTETLTIDKDAGGLIWATWVQDGAVYVNHTVGGDATWGTPYRVPGTPTVKSDDISSLTHVGSRIGVMFSNQLDTHWYYATHGDGMGDAATDWTLEQVPSTLTADDHFSLRGLADGTLYAATKTSDNSSTVPMLLLFKRTAAGTWSNAVFGTGKDSQTRPALVLDPANNLVHMFATGPNTLIKTSGQAGGNIVERTSPMGDIGFSGARTVRIQDDDTARLNDVTSTKQSVTADSGIVIAASDKDADTYWHNELTVAGGTTTPTAPVADFTATPLSGTAPLTVQFTSTSTNASTYAWDFDSDGVTDSTIPNPQHTYDAGTFTAKLLVTGPGGQNAAQKTITVSPAGGGGGGGGGTPVTTTLTPVADTYVKSTSPTKSYGTAKTIQARFDATGANSYVGLVKFDLAGLAGTVSHATLRLWITDASKTAGSVFNSTTGWTEAVTWSSRPAQGNAVAAIGTTTKGAWKDIDVTLAITPGGQISFYVPAGGTDSLVFAGREDAAHAPQLVVTTG